jgi:transmembrane sensor
MKDFRLFDIYDFLMDDDFIRWVRDNEKADNEFWANWLDQNPEKHILVAEARRILEVVRSEQPRIGEKEKEDEIAKLLQTIQGKNSDTTKSAQVHKISVFKKWRVAAAVTLFLVVAASASYFIFRPRTSAEKFTYSVVTTSRGLIENVNTSGKPVSLQLPDGSVVELASNSRIAYDNNFDSSETRDIYLSGEALFTVVKNPAKPFRVFANEIVTKVLGTSFNVRSFEDDSLIQVTVRTGKVSVYSQLSSNIKETASSNKLGGIILAPNQELIYQRSKQQFQKILLDNPLMIVPSEEDKTLLYEDASVEEAFAQLSKFYGVTILYDSESLKNCTITGDLRTVPFYEKVEFICKAIGARYEVIDGQVVIQGGGCD